MSKDLQLIYKDVPLSQLLETDITKLSEDELRVYAQVLQQRRAVPGLNALQRQSFPRLKPARLQRFPSPASRMMNKPYDS